MSAVKPADIKILNDSIQVRGQLRDPHSGTAESSGVPAGHTAQSPL